MLRMKSMMPTIDISTIPSGDMVFTYHLKAVNASYLWCQFIHEFELFSQILGIVENMSCFKCPHCGEPSYIFGKGGTQGTASEMGLEFLGEVCWLYVCSLNFLNIILLIFNGYLIEWSNWSNFLVLLSDRSFTHFYATTNHFLLSFDVAIKFLFGYEHEEWVFR